MRYELDIVTALDRDGQMHDTCYVLFAMSICYPNTYDRLDVMI